MRRSFIIVNHTAYPKIFTIADAKRGDIGNTSKKYAQTFFETYNFDSITISPFMGKDSVEPFLKFKNKYVILLTLTSNPGSKDFQLLKISGYKMDIFYVKVVYNMFWKAEGLNKSVFGWEKNDQWSRLP